ncbi:hypothetical protein KK083_11090 [Fulvivirgaceae bacterium PWU4]|uniref:Insecticide toxin TcdB middle/N-terminal domain-containing protein n=1 Tax=Chryseosolibacter histidini TaxID=2782349 RepID=A0AAP2DNP2_9BACT|nr:SpvB/TcaC N-terminal domain-containing protein [Chryseosolibacter histidini]MBT1697424.1 hypothetical protein [Chryseosolibacter histidini]
MTNALFRLSLVLLAMACTALSKAADNPAPRSAVKVYSSVNHEGVIGVTAEAPADNPADNIFHIQIDEPLCGNEKLYLVYELEGVQDHTSVSRSINDQLATGGYLVKKRRGWAIQREQINASWLKQGDNIVRFTTPEQAQHSYRIRNLRVEVAPSEHGSDDIQIIFNQPSGHYYFGKAYVKGLITGAGNANVRINVAGKPARVSNGEFESLIDLESTPGSCATEIEAVYANGSTTCHIISFDEPLTADFVFALDAVTHRTEKLLDADQGGSISLHGASLLTPAKALGTSSLLSITTLRDVDVAALDDGMVNVTKHHAGFRFLPHGITFGKAVNIHVPYDAAKIPDGYTEADIKTYYFDEQAHHWIPLKRDTVLTESPEVVSRTLHFTDYINAIIKVPESPEVAAHNSTSIKGIKAANPMASVDFIAPPQANNNGSATLSYPLEIPVGRNGIQPQLSISYNSRSGNGWLGLGWSLSIPAISIDTRWGVPRYDPANETETYTLNGDQLSPVAHRGALEPRSTAAKKQFYHRIEGAFNKIERHGTNPTNYYWEVTDKTGTKFFYGATRNGGLDKNAVLRDNEASDGGNIAYWALREVRDLNGNGVQYHYAKPMDTGLAPAANPSEEEKGYQLYIDKITYTEYNGADGKYQVLFTRDREITSPAFTRRKDVTIAGNLGFKQVTADLLMKIEVQFEGKPIRHYQLNYQKDGTSANFYKTLLTGISEYDAAGAHFNTHTFDYYNDVAPGGTFAPLKDIPDNWNPQDDGVHGNFLNSFDLFNDDASALSGTRSSDFSQGLAVTVGAASGPLWSKCNTVGGNFGIGRSKSEGMLTMIDINGDGLSDKVYLDGGTFKYRPNEFASGGSMAFGDEITVTGAGSFLKEKNKSTNWGLQAIGCYGGGNANIGKSWSKSTSTTSVYFVDANGDQLPDVVNNGVVYFNHLDPNTGKISFQPSSGGTPNPIAGGGSVAEGAGVDQQELENAKNANPLHDMVRMWQAPYTGKIKIAAPIRLLPSGDPERSENTADGVKATIQHQDSYIGNSITINQNDYQEHAFSGLDNIQVTKGDRIFFRLQSIDNGSYDSVRWSPVIEYLEEDGKTADVKLTDANHKPLYRFSSEKDFLLSAQQEIATPVPGKVKLVGAFKKPFTTDDVRFQVIRKRASSPDLLVFDKNYKWNVKVDSALAMDIDVAKDDIFQLRVYSSTNVDFTAISWAPHIYYTVSYDPVNKTVLDKNGKPLVNFYPVPEFNTYPLLHAVTRPWKLTEDVEKIKVTPSLAVNNGGFPLNLTLNGLIHFSVKKKDTLLWKTSIQVTKGDLPAAMPSAEITVKQGDTLYFEYDADNAKIATRITQYDAKLMIDGTEKLVKAGVFSALSDDPIFGPFYRGWGHFAYNGNPDRTDRPIDRALLKISDMAKNAGDVDVENDIQDPEDVEGANAYDPAKEMFIMMVPSGENRNWIGYDNLTILTASVMSSSRLGEDDIAGRLTSHGGGNGGGGGVTPAIDKVTKTSGSSFGLGIGYKAIGGGYNSGSNDTEVLSDFMDMNGDRFPDVVTKDFIQFTNAQGVLLPKVPHGHGNHHMTKAISEGASISGTMVESKASATSSNIKKALVSVGNAAAGNGLSADYGEGKSEVPFSWLDINGDGLPDKVRRSGNAGPKPEDAGSQNLKVSLNLGYRFGAEENWPIVENHIQGGKSVSYGGGVGFSFASGSINAGLGASRSENETTGTLEDINGDGLVDELLFSKDQAVKVKLNTGAGFQSAMEWSGATHVNENRSTSESANIAFTGCIPIPVIGIRICINPSTSVGHGVSRELTKFTDINGDGYPDYVHSEKDNQLVVKHSTIGRTNLLKSVHRPLGAAFTMTYTRVGNTYAMPNSLWVMDGVQVFDGFAGDGVDNTLTTFTYEGGFHDRHERDFYGFAKVITRTHDTGKGSKPVYTILTQTFNNDNYYTKGLLLSELKTDGAGNKFEGKENVYVLKNIFNGNDLTAQERVSDAGSAFPALTETNESAYEGQSDPGKTTGTRYAYNKTGDVTTYTELGDEGAEDDVTATITYHNLENLYVISTPAKITVTGSGTTYRKRESVIDPNTGDIVQIKQYLSDSDVAVYDMAYDQYGNLQKITRPKNHKDQRLSFDYVYDDKVHTYPTKVSNSYGYSSEETYDFSFGQVLVSKDMNGNEISYELDKRGRVAKITGPYEKGGNGYTIKFTYDIDAAIPYAITEHFDPSDPKNPLKTAIFVDGLGRVLQTKKDIAIYQGDGKADVEMMSVSGRVYFDAFGRTVKTYYPVTAPAATPADFIRDPDSIDPTLTEYDVLSRTTKVTLPDKSVTLTQYGFEQDKFGRKQFSTRTTDPNGKQSEQFTDVKERVTSVKNYTSDKPVWTSFKYNAIGEEIEATDDMGNTTFSTYDNLGRRTSRKHPDAGTTTYSYDLAGNMKELVTANLQKSGQAILYTYDFERKSEIIYPENPENNVKYTYGEAGATDNRAGRIVLQEDASGAQEFFYGPLGEVVKNIRTVVIPQHDEQTYTTEWKYDTWNRLTSMTYADGEVVTYTYNAGGLLKNMTGKKKNATYNYVNQLGYDKFEQRVFMAYGNGTKTTYTYEADRRRLKNLTAQTAAKRLFMDNSYSYDKMNNILGLKNSAPVPSPNLMGGAGEYSYEYDELYRLTKATGSFKGSNDVHTYTLSMAYNSVGGITHKTQNHQRKGVVQKKTTYDLSYTYSSEQPHAPVHIGDQTYTYDADGNQTGWTHDKTGQRRNIMWDEENRIRSLYDNGSQHHYVYDASGERVLKGKSTGQRVFVNGEWKAGSGQMGNYTVYVNPYLVLRSGSYTKHYYIEGQRIVSKLGGGWDNNGKGPLKAGGSKVDYMGKTQKVFDGIVKNLKFLSADGQILTAGKSGKTPPGQLNGSTTGSTPEKFQYFYHPDHLGSTSYVTDVSGEVYQHLEYFAFGETFVEEHSNTDRTPYLFNGKELDEETGLYYYGARYYDPRSSVWESVDELAEDPEQSGKSPYAYGWNNPVTYNDPDGKCPNCVTAAIGAGLGALIGGGLELGMQLYKGEEVNWGKVGGSALQGAITGGAAGFTGGASLVTTAAVAGTANAVGGAANRAIQGKGTTVKDVVVDATVGAVLGAGGKVVGNAVKGATDRLSNAAKGKLGETVTAVKYAAKGYQSQGKAIVNTGARTATGRTQRAVYDHNMRNVFTGRRLTVESKFNTAGLTPNQVRAAGNVTTPGGLIVDRTTSQQLGNAAKAATVGAGGGVAAQRNQEH